MTFDEVFEEYMTLKIFVDSDDLELKEKYCEASIAHNNKILSNPEEYDAGFDLYLTDLINLNDLNHSEKLPVVAIDYKIKCCAHIVKYFPNKIIKRATAFYTYGRSSISNTAFRLANNQGIIDAGYRGNLIAKMDVYRNLLHLQKYPKYTRLMQICAPNLMPIHVEIVDKLEDLGAQTLRGTGGFGSTGV